MIVTLLATLVITQAKPLACPIMGGPGNTKGAYSDYNGVRVYYCCAGCDTKFEADPKKVSVDAAKKGMVWGASLFDPVSGNRLQPDKAIKETAEFNGVRFYFESAEDKAKFDADPKKYGTLPEKESLFCPVEKEAIANYGKAFRYVDYSGVRYYFCCGGCPEKFAANPTAFVDNAKDHVKAPGVATEKKQD
jgi:YHS domain-containing protein